MLFAVIEPAAERSLRLIADEEHRALLPPEIVLEMVTDASRLAHAARREDDLGLGVFVDGLGVLARNGDADAVRPDGVDPGIHESAGLLVKAFVAALEIDRRRLVCHGAVYIDGEAVVTGDELFLADLADIVEHLLRASDSERRDDEIAAAVERALDVIGQQLDRRDMAVVQAVAVGRFDHNIVRVRDRFRHVADDGLVEIADIAAEHHLALHAVLGHKDLDAGAAEQVAHIAEADGEVLADLHQLVIAHRAQMRDGGLGVVERVDRLIRRSAGAAAFAVAPLGLALLNVRAVAQHDAAEIARLACGVNGAVKPVFEKQRQIAGVVDVRMGQKDKVDLPRRHRQLLVFKDVLPLLHAAVNKAAVIPALDECAAARNFMGRAQKGNFHSELPCRGASPTLCGREAAYFHGKHYTRSPPVAQDLLHPVAAIRFFVVPAPREHGALAGAPLQFPFDSTFAVCGEDILRKFCYTFFEVSRMDQIKMGKFIAALRKEKSLTQEKLGEKLGVTNKTVSRWENGNYMPDVEMLSLLSEEFGVSINELISGERLAAEDFKKAADSNLVTALSSSTFTLKEKIAFFKKKWLHEHISTIVLCVVAWIGIIIWTALKLRGSDSYALLGAVGSMLAILFYLVLYNRMMAYVEKRAYPAASDKETETKNT